MDCSISETQCIGDALATCLADGTWGAAAACGDGMVCSGPMEGMPGDHCMPMNDSEGGEATEEEARGGCPVARFPEEGGRRGEG